GAWRYPGSYPYANFNFAHLKSFAQALERSKFDAFFMADHLADGFHAALDIGIKRLAGGKIARRTENHLGGFRGKL
ncbi:hypothetical protein ACC754_45285, partial [Rhizobium johnstonii]